MIKALSTVRNPRLQNPFLKKGKEESLSAQPLNPKMLSLSCRGNAHSQGGGIRAFHFLPSVCTEVLQTKHNYKAMDFWWNTTEVHFLVQQTELEGTRSSLKPVQLTHVVWRLCKRCCFFREMGRKSLSFHFYPTYALLSSFCISPRTVTIEEIKLLHTTDPMINKIISSD